MCQWERKTWSGNETSERAESGHETTSDVHCLQTNECHIWDMILLANTVFLHREL